MHAAVSFLAAASGRFAAPWLALAVLTGCDARVEPDLALRSVQGASAERGKALLDRYQCGSCHAVPGARTGSPLVASPLDGWGRRSYIAGVVPNTPHALQRWLQSPSSLRADATMPDLGVTERDARDIAAYLLSLQ
jgi:cytochrome c